MFLKQFIFEKRYQPLRHIVFWSVTVFVLVALYGATENNFEISTITTLFLMPVDIFLTYTIILWLLPKYLLKGKYLLFSLLFFSLLISAQVLAILLNHFAVVPVITGTSPFDFQLSFYEFADWYKLVVSCSIAAVAVLIRMIKYWQVEQQQKMQAEKEKINAELELLQAQLHPHFLFNTLNNIYSLVREKSDNAPRMLLRLSDILSYVLYECKADFVLLSKEISVIKNYVELEKERYGERLEISTNFSGDIENQMIVPMLFQPFIENAFKHGTSEQLGKVWISIDLSVKNNELCFKVINSCDALQESSYHKKGIGITNVKKRLEFLYRDKYQLQHGFENNVYIVSLIIYLQNERSKEKNPLKSVLQFKPA